jgi:hypothetical protein
MAHPIIHNLSAILISVLASIPRGHQSGSAENGCMPNPRPVIAQVVHWECTLHEVGKVMVSGVICL